jgi:hypothetical protein
VKRRGGARGGHAPAASAPRVVLNYEERVEHASARSIRNPRFTCTPPAHSRNHISRGRVGHGLSPGVASRRNRSAASRSWPCAVRLGSRRICLSSPLCKLLDGESFLMSRGADRFDAPRPLHRRLLLCSSRASRPLLFELAFLTFATVLTPVRAAGPSTGHAAFTRSLFPASNSTFDSTLCEPWLRKSDLASQAPRPRAASSPGSASSHSPVT